MLYMPQRTQIYLRDDQRARLDELAQRRRLTMAEVVRRAIDSYLDADDDLDATFGAVPGLRAKVPSRDEWDGG
jgi:predicted transcriptional regulator